MRPQALLILVCAAFTLLVVLTAWVIFFRLSCRLCKLPSPSVPRTLGIVIITFVAASITEIIMAASVRGTYSELNLPLWEAGFAAFFVGLPIDMVVNAGIHSLMMKIPIGKGIEVWFVQRVMLFSVILLIGACVLVAFLAGQN
jgi:hypothetical protein